MELHAQKQQKRGLAISLRSSIVLLFITLSILTIMLATNVAGMAFANLDSLATARTTLIGKSVGVPEADSPGAICGGALSTNSTARGTC